VQLLYLGKLSRPRYQQKLNKLMKIAQEDVILIKNLYLWKQYGVRRVLSKLPDKGWKLKSIDNLLKRTLKTGTIVRQPGSGRPHSARAVGDLVLSQEDKPKRHRSAREISYETAILFSSVYTGKYSRWSPAHMLQTTSCSAVVWSQSYLPSHSLINNLIVCNKSCYCSIINDKLNNK